MPAPRRPLSDLSRLPASGASLAEILPELGPHLDAVLGIDSYALHWYGAKAELTAFHADATWSAAAIDAYLADYRGRQEQYRPVTQERLASGEVFALSPGELARRPVFHEVIAPLGLGSFLNLPFALGSKSLILTCARERSKATARGRFTTAEINRAGRIREMLGPVFDAPPQPAELPPRSIAGGGALLLLNRAGELQYACAEGQRFLAFLRADARWSQASAMKSWLDALLLRHRGDGAVSSSWMQLTDGAYQIELRPMGASGAGTQAIYALHIRRAHTAANRLLALARRHGLSPRELAVAQRLHRGEALRDIAAALRISETTLKTQTRSLYGRIGVSDRHELRRVIDSFGANPLEEQAAP